MKNDAGVSGLKDDVTGLMDAVPFSFTGKNEMIWVIQPNELAKWLKSNPEKAALAANRLPWLKDFSEFSNPIIAIGKCKE